MIDEPLHTICYISTLLDDLSPADVTRLSAAFSVSNTKKGVSGCMGIRRREVMQVLEGPRDIVERLYQRIQADPRHVEVTRMASTHITRRRFEGWGMIELPYGAVVEVADQIRKIHGR
ncbi:BLUF domain-containing protein [Aureimonas altamirensis]|uniref:BLUF domain-containing protein n=1 Tax=Aureimonas altamirensis TaxID=370622 RepID=UPI001E2BC4E3|nr:BLUF domain-containing protein [Aureimonas altamirensis]UHD45888.1 BLUF domain-containing protein [Aureimonas altamirensis]